MGLVDGKTVLVLGVANRRSIAWGIASRLRAEGAQLAFSYAAPELERRVRPLAEELGAAFVEPCDVREDAAIDGLFERLGMSHDRLDGVVHSVAFGPKDDVNGPFLDIGREGFHATLDVSAYSLIAIARRAAPLMTQGGAIVTMSSYASEKVFPRYSVMAIAKAALECEVRYLASELGPRRIRVNAISAGPIRTLATSTIDGFGEMQRLAAEVSPLRRELTIEDAGAVAAWLMSDLAAAVTGDVIRVDGGYHVLGVTRPTTG